MNRSRITGNLTSHGILYSDIANDRVGIGSTIPGNKLSLPDSAKIGLGNAEDLTLYHDSGTSFIKNTTGNLRIQDSNGNIQIQAKAGEESIIAKSDGAVELYFNNTKRIETTNTGAVVTGILTATTEINAGRLSLLDNGSTNPTLLIAGDDGNPWGIQVRNDTYATGHEGLKIFQSNTGITYFQTRGTSARGRLVMQQHNGTTTNNMIEFTEAGAVEIDYAGTKKLETTSLGVTVTGQLEVTTGANSFVTSANVFKGTAGQKGVYLRSALSAEGTPSYSSVDDTNTGMFLPGSDVCAFTTGGSEALRIDSDGKILMGTEIVNGSNADAAIKLFLSSSRASYGGQATNAVIFDNQTAGVDKGGTLTLAGYSGTTAVAKAAIRGGNEGSSSTNNGYFSVFTRPASGSLGERLRIDSSGRLLINATATRAIAGGNSMLQIEKNSSELATFLRTSNDNGAAWLAIAKSRSAAGAACVAGDNIGAIAFIPHDGTDLNHHAAEIRSYVDTGIGSNDTPGYLSFHTNGGAATTTERVRITSAGDAQIHVDGSNGTSSQQGVLRFYRTAYSTDMKDSRIVFDTSTGSTNSNNDGTYAAVVAGKRSSTDNGSSQLSFYTCNSTNSFAAAERLRITENGSLGTNATVRSAYGGLDLCSQGATNYGTLTLGAGGGQNGQSRSANQENQFRIMSPTYADPSKMFAVMYGTSGTAGHDLFYGGGTGWAYATNTHRFLTTANQTTAIGTERLRITSAGNVTTTGESTFDRATAGFTARAGDSVGITRASGTPLEINRTGSDGPLINLFNDGSNKASIDIIGNDLNICCPATNNRLNIYSDGSVEVLSDNGLRIYTDTNQAGAKIFFSDNDAKTQRGHIKYYHADATVASGYGEGFIIGGTESNGCAVRVDGGLKVPDLGSAGNGARIYCGTSNDFSIWHDGSLASYVSGITNGHDVHLRAKRDIYIAAGDNAGGYHTMIYCDNNGGVRLSYDNTPVAYTVNTGFRVVGDEGLQVYSGTNNPSTGARIEFSDHQGGSYVQQGILYYRHSDGSVTTNSQSYGNYFCFDHTESNGLGVRINGDIHCYGTQGSWITGTTDGVLNLNTTSGNGTFIRFKENNSTKTWVGCSEGLGAGDQDDLGLRATDKIIFLKGSTARAYFHSDGHFQPWGNNSYNLGSSGDRWKTIYSNNSLNTSDRNEKNNILDCTLGLDFIKKLKPISYKWKEDDGKTHYGLIAQDVEKVVTDSGMKVEDFGSIDVPEKLETYVNEDGREITERYGLSYVEFIAPLIKSVQELSAKVESLQTEIDTLKSS